MPVSTEVIPNRALSGEEVAQLILEDCERLIANESLLAPHLAYGRVSYSVTLTLHIDNQFIPVSTSFVNSERKGSNLVGTEDKPGAMPELSALEPAPPLASPSSEAILSAAKVERNVTSPNAERLRTGQGVPADVRQPDNTFRTETIKYPRSGEEGDVTITNVTDSERAKLKV
jgi:hypothetical protein